MSIAVDWTAPGPLVISRRRFSALCLDVAGVDIPDVDDAGGGCLLWRPVPAPDAVDIGGWDVDAVAYRGSRLPVGSPSRAVLRVGVEEAVAERLPSGSWAVFQGRGCDLSPAREYVLAAKILGARRAAEGDIQRAEDWQSGRSR
ncbi:MAG: hypothetical protein Q8Q14_02715 [Gemmatimonadales bacterium]|nr:hypothetical protein [Gemmatimonadales bacterium]